MTTHIQTRDQKRADLVFNHIQEIKNDKKLAEDYGSLVVSSPTLIRSAGLVQGLAFYEAKGKPHHKRFLNNLENELQILNIITGPDTLTEKSRKSNLVEYMRLTQEVLALCQWHKRFAQSILDAKTGGNQ